MGLNHLKESYAVDDNFDIKNINHKIKVKNYNTNEIEIISEYKNINDYLLICIGSAYMPFPFIKPYIYSKERNKCYCDGSLDKYWYLSFILLPFIYLREYIKYIFNIQNEDIEEENNEEKIIDVNVEILNEYIKPIQYILYLYYVIIGYFTKQEWIYLRGYKYAEKNLKPKLQKLNINPKPEEQVSSLDINETIANFKIKYDEKMESFL